MSNVPADHEYFFAVGSHETVMSSVWRVWTWPGKSDIYISEQGSVGSFKASLHQDGRYRMGFAQEFVQQQRARGNWNLADRATDKWKATEIAPGIQMPFRLLIPANELRPSAPGWSTKKQVIWLPVPPSNCAYEIRLYLGNTHVRESITVHSPDGGLAGLWQRPLANGWVLVLLAKVGPFPDQEQHKVDLVRQNILTFAATILASVLENGRLRVIALGYADDNSRHFIDMALDVPISNKA
jgi:hypothetical protein